MMSERQVKKRAVNLFVDAELLDEARRMRINVSETLRTSPALHRAGRTRQARVGWRKTAKPSPQSIPLSIAMACLPASFAIARIRS